jgi:hypothetical protein
MAPSALRNQLVRFAIEAGRVTLGSHTRVMAPEIHRELVFPGDGEMSRLMREKRWELTSLGPVETWPAGLLSAVRIVLTSRFSMWMGWGDELAFLYNDAYRVDTLGTKHPRVLGGPTRETWSEIWDEIGPRIATVIADGRATWDEGLLLIRARLRARAPARRGAGRARPRQDRVLLQRQPRVPHAAHPDARPARRPAR